MAAHVFYAADPGRSLAASFQRAADGLYYDFADATFKATPTTLASALAEGTGSLAGSYSMTIASTPQATWPDGAYVVRIHDTANSNLVIDTLGDTFFGGDDGPAPPSAVSITDADATNIADKVAAAAGDPPGVTTLLARVPGTVQPQTGDAYARLGTAGAGLTALGDARLAHLDADVSGRLAAAGYTAPPSAASVASAVWGWLVDGKAAGKLLGWLAAVSLGRGKVDPATGRIDWPSASDPNAVRVSSTPVKDADGNVTDRGAVTLTDPTLVDPNQAGG